MPPPPAHRTHTSKTSMLIILFSYLATTYIFSGLVCWLAFLRNFNQISKLSGWQRLVVVLTSPIIVVLWPIWIIIEIRKLNSSNKEARPPIYPNSNSNVVDLREKSLISSK